MSGLNIPALALPKMKLKTVIYAITGLAFVALVITALLLKLEISRLETKYTSVKGWQDDVIQDVSLATVPPDKNGKVQMLSPDGAKAGLKSLVMERDSSRKTLRDIDKKTKAAKKQADDAEAALKVEQGRNEKKRLQSQKRIEELQKLVPTGDDVADRKAEEDAVDAAWNNWR